MPTEPPASTQSAQAAVESLYARDPASQALGIEILEVSAGRVRIAMTIRAEMLNGYGMCHGGVVFAFADTAFAFACNSHGEPMVAAGASIEFLAPTAAGERIGAIATEILRTDRFGIYDVVVAASSGGVIAHFRGRCARFRPPPPLHVKDHHE
ncbi:MAG: hydroxyphenylacetyl-CoA thioesterase PaaI [Pseudomonadota bacterium]|nr:hydroxyphenylacetyl-CoA thioesterase PaaI [Pseudomonadota bacterium]